MKEFRWNALKSKRLKKTRGVSFEEIIQAHFIGIIKHPKMENQRIMLYWHKNYVWVVPSVRERDYIFLKTIYPSRKYTKNYLLGRT